MEPNQILFIVMGILGALLAVVCGVLFFVSRRSARAMESMLDLMTKPQRARVADAVRILETIMAGEIAKIESSFKSMNDATAAQIAAADKMREMLAEQNKQLIAAADDATKKMVQMTSRLDNTLGGLRGVVDSDDWNAVANATDKFGATVGEMLERINETSNTTTTQMNQVREQIDAWVSAGRELSDNLKSEFAANDEQMKTLATDTDALATKLGEMTTATATGFENVKKSAADYVDVMDANNRALDNHLAKMDSFGNQSKKQLTAQVNKLANTANVVGGQVRLVETSIENQVGKLADAVRELLGSATKVEGAISNISTEMSTLTNKFNGEIREFATGVVTEIKTVSGVANNTLENTKTAAGKFSESVSAMATGVRETLIEMNTAHTQLSAQSENLIKMSSETTAQLQPLSQLIEKYFAALPDLSREGTTAGENLERIVNALNEKINAMRTAVDETTTAVSESAVKLEDLAGTSRQQMIDLMSDYTRAVDTMQTLNKQMMVARAAAPMDAIATAPAKNTAGVISSIDFLKQCEREFDKLHEQSMDLTRVTGAEIPDVVWRKFHGGDKTIFSKWLAKMLGAADKKQIRDMIKSDSVFRSQAMQFVRGFDKIVVGAKNTDNADRVAAALLKTDLGRIYTALRTNIG